MHNSLSRVALTIALLLGGMFSTIPAYAQLTGTDTVPGAACSHKGAVRMTANATGPGAYVLTCSDDAPTGTWVATLNTALPIANVQVANKEYVDTAVAAATCSVQGQVCPDGTIFAGFFCRTAAAMGASCPKLYIPPGDQSISAQWKTSTGTNDIATDSSSNGQTNSNQVPNSATFPAFKLCKDLTYGSHTDWYLPASEELQSLYSMKALLHAFNIADASYWSSTEFINSYAYLVSLSDGSLNSSNKTNTNRVRCVRRE